MHELNLPSSTVVNKILSKRVFEGKIKSGRKLLEDISRIIFAYKLSPATINIPSTKAVEELHVYHLFLKSKEIPQKAISGLGKFIPYPILFCFIYEDDFCYGISLLHEQKLYFSAWNDAIIFNFNDTNLESVYENIVKKFLLHVQASSNIPLKELLELENKITLLQKETLSLLNKIKKEKQFKKQLELSRILKPKQQELKELLRGIT